MVTIEWALTVGFRCGGDYRHFSKSDDIAGVHIFSRRFSQAGGIDMPRGGVSRLIDGSSLKTRSNVLRSRVRATAEYSGSASDPLERNGKPYYHPFEEIAETASQDNGDARLTAAETTRTIIEVNSKATLMFSGLINEEIQESIFWPELPYVTDEHGNIYFQVSNDEDILQTLTSDNNFVQVIIGFDSMEMLSEMELSGPSEIDFGIEEIEDEDSDIDDDEDDDFEEDWVAVLDDEEDETDSDETLDDWAKLETMRSSHPMSFAKRMAEITSDDPVDWMDQPPAGLAIQGLLRPAFMEEHSVIQKCLSGKHSSDDDTDQVGKIMDDKLEEIGTINGNGHKSSALKDSSAWAEELEKDENLGTGTAFYKMEMLKIQLISAYGHQTSVDVKDFQKARPDAIAHSATKIISRLKAGGEKITQALSSLCWRCKGIQVEEATIVGVDSLGFDLRVCSGTQVQTLRFAFNTRATSEYSADRQLNDVLFPRTLHKSQKRRQAHQKEC